MKDFKPYWEYVAIKNKNGTVVADTSKIWIKNTEDQGLVEEDITLSEKPDKVPQEAGSDEEISPENEPLEKSQSQIP